MNTHGNLGVTTGILLIIMILIGAVAGSVIIDETQNVSAPDLNQLTNEALDEITTYLQIKTIVGKYETVQGKQAIQKIAILIKPLVSGTIDITKVTILISHGDDLRILFFNGQVAPVRSHSVFNHPQWDTLNDSSFSLLSTIDDDSSMTQYHVMNKNTDMAFIMVNLPITAPLYYGDSLQLTLTPSPGTERTVTLEPPMPTTQIVSLYD